MHCLIYLSNFLMYTIITMPSEYNRVRKIKPLVKCQMARKVVDLGSGIWDLDSNFLGLLWPQSPTFYSLFIWLMLRDCQNGPGTLIKTINPVNLQCSYGKFLHIWDNFKIQCITFLFLTIYLSDKYICHRAN